MQLGCVRYGFQPLKTDASMDELLKMTHGIDERISVKNLVFGTSVLYQLVEQFTT
jgi:acetylornithine deacetylase/succinyl-diaminopimelate desuccinylase-like protein